MPDAFFALFPIPTKVYLLSKQYLRNLLRIEALSLRASHSTYTATLY